MSEPEINMNRYCSACENIVHHAECMLNHKQKIIPISSSMGLINGLAMPSSEDLATCALSYFAASIVSSIIENLVDDRKMETRYKLVKRMVMNQLIHQSCYSHYLV